MGEFGDSEALLLGQLHPCLLSCASLWRNFGEIEEANPARCGDFLYGLVCVSGGRGSPSMVIGSRAGAGVGPPLRYGSEDPFPAAASRARTGLRRGPFIPYAPR